MSQYDAILSRIDAVGWLPTRLCEEASKALALIPLPPSPHLDDRDQLGVQWTCLFLTYCRRFLGEMQRTEAETGQAEIATMSFLAAKSLLLQLGAKKTTAGRDEPITGDDYFRWVDEFQSWYKTRLRPARVRLEQRGSTITAEEVEPALTLALVDRGYVLVDWKGVRRDIGRGVAMNAEGSLRPRGIVPISDADIVDFLKFLKGCEAGVLDSKGNLRLHPETIKTALDAAIGRVNMKSPEELEVEIGSREVSHSHAPEERAVQREVALGLKADLQALPAEVRDMVEEVLEVQHVQDVLDVLHAASVHEDPAHKAAILHRAWSGKISRARLARAFNTTPERIRAAEKTR